ncbi:MAG TPA: pilus assembly protein PilM [Gammaproteobacteria bacterium]
MAQITFDAPPARPRLDICRFIPAAGAEQQRILERLRTDLQLDKSTCISVAESDSFSLLLIEAPDVDPLELKAAVRWRIKELLDFHIDDAIIDVFDIPGQQERGRPKLMYVVASRISTVQQHIDLLESQEINLSVIDIPELAMRNIAALLPEDEGGVAMLYLGQDSGLLTLTRQKNLFLARKLETGTRQLLDYLDQGEAEEEYVLDPEESAEGGDVPVDEMPQSLRYALDSIVLEIQRSLDYYESHFSLPPVSGLVLVPMAQPIPGMMEYIAGRLGVPMHTLDLNAFLESEQTLSDELQSQCLLSIGAALRQENRAL